MFIIFLVVSLASLRPQLARDVWCLWWGAGDTLRTAGIGVRGVIPSLDTLASSVMCHVLPPMNVQYYTFSTSLSIPSLRHSPFIRPNRRESWSGQKSHSKTTRSHSLSLPNKPEQVPDLYMKYKRTRIQHARRPRSYELPPLKK